MQVFLKWRRSFTQMGQTGAVTVGPDGVASWEFPITLDVTHRKTKAGAGEFRSKQVRDACHPSPNFRHFCAPRLLTSTAIWCTTCQVWFTLKEKVPERPGVILSVNPSIAKGVLELARFVGAGSKPVSIELEPKAKTDALDPSGQRPVLNLVLTSKPREASHEE